MKSHLTENYVSQHFAADAFALKFKQTTVGNTDRFKRSHKFAQSAMERERRLQTTKKKPPFIAAHICFFFQLRPGDK